MGEVWCAVHNGGFAIAMAAAVLAMGTESDKFARFLGVIVVLALGLSVGSCSVLPDECRTIEDILP